MIKLTPPFTAYVLTPAMLIKKVEIAKRSRWYGFIYETINGHSYHQDALHETAQAAIAAGRAKVEAQREKLAKQASNIEKRIANLDKAESKL